MLLFQADFDVDYFAAVCSRTIATRGIELLRETLLSTYRWQYITSGMLHPRFADLLGQMINAYQAARIRADLVPALQEYPRTDEGPQTAAQVRSANSKASPGVPEPLATTTFELR